MPDQFHFKLEVVRKSESIAKSKAAAQKLADTAIFAAFSGQSSGRGAGSAHSIVDEITAADETQPELPDFIEAVNGNPSTSTFIVACSGPIATVSDPIRQREQTPAFSP